MFKDYSAVKHLLTEFELQVMSLRDQGMTNRDMSLRIFGNHDPANIKRVSNAITRVKMKSDRSKDPAKVYTPRPQRLTCRFCNGLFSSRKQRENHEERSHLAPQRSHEEQPRRVVPTTLKPRKNGLGNFDSSSVIERMYDLGILGKGKKKAA